MNTASKHKPFGLRYRSLVPLLSRPPIPQAERPLMGHQKESVMLSRTAEHLFWMVRDMERAESAKRFDEATTQQRAIARSGVFGQKGVCNAL